MENINNGCSNSNFDSYLITECINWCNNLLQKCPEFQEFSRKYDALINEWKEKFASLDFGPHYCKVLPGYELGIVRIHLYLCDLWSCNSCVLTFVLLPNWKFKIIRPYLGELLNGDTSFVIIEDYLKKLMETGNMSWEDLYGWLNKNVNQMNSDWQLRDMLKPPKREFTKILLPQILSRILKRG
jgi:hypothetical protein